MTTVVALSAPIATSLTERENSDIGVIFHWGLYSVSAYDDVKSARRRRMGNGSEWYLKRLAEKGDYRPISGWKETQEYHGSTYKDRTYESLTDVFVSDPAKIWNPDTWMELCKRNGVEYVILTAKHHDGFCLWNTDTTAHNCVQKGPKQNLLQRFKESALKYNLKFGIYYSWFEFNKSVTKEFVNNVMIPQMNELIEYSPDIWWFDGHWSVTTKYANDNVKLLIEKIKTRTPNAQINDRLYGHPDTKKLYADPNYIPADVSAPTFRVYGDRGFPSSLPTVKWEYIDMIGLSWGYNKQQQKTDYKTGDQLYELYSKTRRLNGSFLLNLGPDSNGNLDPNEVESLNSFGSKLHHT